MKRHALTDEQWQIVDPLVPESKARTGRPPRDRRLMLDGALWILATGAPWRDLPERFGPWQTVYDHFSKWRRSGVLASIVQALQIKLDQQGLIDWDVWCVDGASVVTVQSEMPHFFRRGGESSCFTPVVSGAIGRAAGCGRPAPDSP